MNQAERQSGSGAACWLAPVLGAVLVSLAGCSSGEVPVERSATDAIVELIVEPAQLTLRSGEQGLLAAQANDERRRAIGGAEFEFSVEDPALLSVTPQGVVTALGPAAAQTHVRVASWLTIRDVPVRILPGDAKRIEPLTPDLVEVVAGVAPKEPLRVRVLDDWGNPVPGYGLVAPDINGDALTSGLDGTASLPLPAMNRAGAGTYELHGAGAAGPRVRFTIKVAPAAPANAELLSHQVLEADGQQTLRFRLRVLDGFGNPVPAALAEVGFAGRSAARVEARADNAGVVSAELAMPKRAQDGTRLEVRFAVRSTPPVVLSLGARS